MYFNKLFNHTNNDPKELEFIKSEHQRELLKPVLTNWSVSSEELETLYLNNHIILKNSSLKFITFPASFWLTGIFSFVQLFIFIVFFLAFLTSDSKSLLSYIIGISSVFLIIMALSIIYQSMMKPVNILLKNYHCWGKYNNFNI